MAYSKAMTQGVGKLEISGNLVENLRNELGEKLHSGCKTKHETIQGMPSAIARDRDK